MSRESEPLKVAIHCSYPLVGEGQNGVADYTTQLHKHLGEEGISSSLIGPSLRKENLFLLPLTSAIRRLGRKRGLRSLREENNLADATLGRAFKPPLFARRTEARVTFTTNKARAENTLRLLKADVLVLQEPGAGNGGHTLLSAAPKRDDGQLLLATILSFHAQDEELTLSQKLARIAVQFFRRPKFSKYGVPIDITPGPLNTIGRTDARMAVSHSTAQYWKNNYFKDNIPFEIIPNGIETDILTPYGPRIEQWHDGKKTILFTGRHDERKGIKHLLLAYDLLRKGGVDDIKLKIVGRGEQTPELQKLVGQRSIPDVEFLEPFIDRADLAKAYRTADVFVSPAIGGEGWGRTLAEAMACGTLVVGSDINGYREVIGGKPFARMARPQNPRDLADKINELLKLPEEERKRLGEQASLYVIGNFAWRVVGRRVADFFRKVSEKHGRPKREDWLKRGGIIFQRNR